MKKDTRGDTERNAICEKVVFCFGIIVLMAFVILCINMNGEIKAMQKSIDAMEVEIIGFNRGLTEGSEGKSVENNTEFLEKEITRHQNFIETQRQQLLWFVSVIGAIGLFVITFLGFRTRTEIENALLNKELKIAKHCMDSYIGGSENHRYLKRAIRKEKRAQRAKILFITKVDSSSIDVKEIMKRLPITNDNIYIEEIGDTERFDCTKLKSKDIVIYEVQNWENKGKDKGTEKNGVTEEEKEATKNYIYMDIQEECEKENIACILFTNGCRIESLENKNYISMTNYIPNLIQMIVTMLYLEES